MKNPPVIILVGKTHSGKTTFARLLKEKAPTVVSVETDTIAIFLREQFPDIVAAEQIESTGAFVAMSLRFEIFQSILTRALKLDRPLVLSNSNMWKEGRRIVIEECRKLNRPAIGVYFDLPIDLLRTRTENSARDIRVLRTSKNFGELLERQATRFQEPDPAEFDEYLSVHSLEEYDSLIDSLAQRLS